MMMANTSTSTAVLEEEEIVTATAIAVPVHGDSSGHHADADEISQGDIAIATAIPVTVDPSASSTCEDAPPPYHSLASAPPQSASARDLADVLSGRAQVRAYNNVEESQLHASASSARNASSVGGLVRADSVISQENAKRIEWQSCINTVLCDNNPIAVIEAMQTQMGMILSN